MWKNGIQNTQQTKYPNYNRTDLIFTSVWLERCKFGFTRILDILQVFQTLTEITIRQLTKLKKNLFRLISAYLCFKTISKGVNSPLPCSKTVSKMDPKRGITVFEIRLFFKSTSLLVFGKSI